jgi:hypothetical protein
VGDTEGVFVPPSDIGQFTVNVPRAIYFASMDTNPGWTFEAQWQYGKPLYASAVPRRDSPEQTSLAIT